MSIKVHFYTFGKKSNSTEQPTGDGNVYDCTFLEGADILSPAIRLNVLHNNAVTAWNYCYIPDFSRYYFIQRWFFADGMWNCVCAVDVLASWKSAIGSHTGYVLRCSSDSDGDIKDTFYPAKTSPVHNSWPIQLSQQGFTWADSFGDGYYIVGVVCGKDGGVGGNISYYVFSPNDFAAFCAAIYNNQSDWIQSASITDISTELLKTLFNPFEYIVSVMWFPMTVPTLNSVSSVPLGWWNVPVSASPLNAGNCPVAYYTITPAQHPQAATRGNYLNSSPYTNITIDWQPWGIIPIDASVVAGNPLEAHLTMDFVSGTCVLRIYVVKADTTYTCVYSSAAQVGVPVQIAGRQPSTGSMIAGAAGVLIDSATAVTGVLGDIAEVGSTMYNALTTGNKITTTASGIVSQVADGLKRMSSTGSNGSRAQVEDKFWISMDYLLITDEDNAQFGRPLYKVKQISSLSGYVLMGDADISFPGMAQEIDAVRAHMVKGFFYE